MHKPIISLLLRFVLSSSTLFAQSSDSIQIAGRVEALPKAILNPDEAELESFVADKISYGHSTDLIEAAFVDNLASGKTAFNTLLLSDQTIRVAGDVAIVRNRFEAELKNREQTKVTLVFLNDMAKAKKPVEITAETGSESRRKTQLKS